MSATSRWRSSTTTPATASPASPTHFVGHDRAIRIRCDDSIARVVDGAAMVLRRARGLLAPAPLRVERAVARPTLALGGHL